MFYLLALAAASEPTEPVVREDGTVSTSVVIAAPPEDVKRLLSDPIAAAKLVPDILGTRVIQRGSCDLVEVSTRGMTTPLTYVVKRCPTADGFKETMVSSEDFNQVKVDWKLEAVSGGTRVSYTILSEPDLPVPTRIISSLTAKSAVAALKNLVARITGQ